jgi:hypothetical protein
MLGKDWVGRMVSIGFGVVVMGQGTHAEEYSASAGQSLALEIRDADPGSETDALLNATCIASNMIDIRIGGELGFGKGGGEPTSLTLSAGTLSARIDGVSVLSPDYEMTGGSMLLTSVEPNGKTMQILASGKPIVFKPPDGTSHKVSLGKTATDIVKTFIKDCENSDR